MILGNTTLWATFAGASFETLPEIVGQVKPMYE